MRSDDLRQVEPFRDLDDPALARLMLEFEEIHVPAEYPVFREGSAVASTISARTLEASCLLKIEKRSLLDFLADQPVITLKLQMAAAKRHTINAAAALELGQRSEVRIRVKRGVALKLEDGSSRPAFLDNLCSGGLSLRGAPPDWREGDFVRFELGLANDSLPCEGRIAWIEDDLVGLAFTDTSEDHDTRVQQSLHHLLAPRRRAVS